MILASRDTDLVPALEMAVDCKDVEIEVATWENTSRLILPDKQIWCTYMTGDRYMASKDSEPYSTAASGGIRTAYTLECGPDGN